MNFFYLLLFLLLLCPQEVVYNLSYNEEIYLFKNLIPQKRYMSKTSSSGQIFLYQLTKILDHFTQKFYERIYYNDLAFKNNFKNELVSYVYKKSKSFLISIHGGTQISFIYRLSFSDSFNIRLNYSHTFIPIDSLFDLSKLPSILFPSFEIHLNNFHVNFLLLQYSYEKYKEDYFLYHLIKIYVVI